MTHMAFERARAIFVRVALVVVLFASVSGHHATLADEPAPEAQGGSERPTEAWQVSWTVQQNVYHKTTMPGYSTHIEWYRLNISASYVTALFDDPYRWETDDFAFSVEEDIQNLYTKVCDGGGPGRYSDYKHRWATKTLGADYPDDDEFGLLFYSSNDGEQRLAALDVGYMDIATHSHQEIQPCGEPRTYDFTKVVNWSPLCAGSYELVGNEEGNEYTFHTETYPDDFNCLGPILLAQPPEDGEFTFSYIVDISARLVEADDLTVKHLEVTQGLQDLGNNMPLAQDRRTIVRAFIDTGVAPVRTTGVDGKLEAYAGGTKLGEISPTNPNGTIIAPPRPDWKKIDDTLNFELPRAWTEQGPLELKVTVNPNHAITELNYENNDLSETVDFGVCKTIRVGYVKVGVRDEELVIYPGDRVSRNHQFALLTLPIPWENLDYYHWGDLEGPYLVETREEGTALLRKLATLRHLGLGPTPEYMVGWLPQFPTSWNAAGLAFRGGFEMWAMDYTAPDIARVIFAHEFVHMVGRPHVNETTAGMHWFDVYNYVIKPPSAGETLQDFMEPVTLMESVAWASPQTYRAAYNKFCGGGTGSAATESNSANATTAQATVANALLVSADVFSSTTSITGTLGPILQLANAQVSLPPEGGAFCVDLKDATDTLLDSYCFDANAADAFPDVIASTSMVITRPLGLDRVELYDMAKQIVLDTRVASTNTPTVTVNAISEVANTVVANSATAFTANASPTAGFIVSGTTTISWTGLDADGDPLTYHVLYSPDDGVTWRGVDALITDQSTTVNFASQPGTKGTTGRIKVIVTDGFNTAEDVTDVPFAVAGKDPVAEIVAPVSGGTFSGRTFVALYGAGDDREDGVMEGASLAWTSDIDGALGTGRVVEADLSPGAHTITLTVTDSDGQQATVTIQLTVTDATVAPTTIDVYLPRIQR